MQAAGGSVTMPVRPEHATLEPPEDAMLSGRLANVVYVGTDTHYHVEFAQGGRFVIRRQNSPGQTQDWHEGQQVGVSFAAGTGQVLRD